jgi:hypothetical protein
VAARRHETRLRCAALSLVRPGMIWQIIASEILDSAIFILTC